MDDAGARPVPRELSLPARAAAHGFILSPFPLVRCYNWVSGQPPSSVSPDTRTLRTECPPLAVLTVTASG